MIPPISAIVLAGGQGRRMGGQDKGWQHYRGKPLIERVLARLQPQTDDLVISCNRNLARYRALGWQIVRDAEDHYLGPLAGITAAAPYCRHPWIQLCPCDTPYFPLDLCSQLLTIATAGNANAVIPIDGSGPHYLCALVHQRTVPVAAAQLADRQLAVRAWLTAVDAITAPVSVIGDAFTNINSATQLTHRHSGRGT